MRRTNGRAPIGLLVLLAGIAAVQGYFLLRLEDRVSDLEGGRAAAAPAAAPGAAGEKLLLLEHRISRAERTLEAVSLAAERADLLSEDNAEALRRMDRDLAGRPASDGPGPLPEAAIREAVAAEVRRRIAELPRGEGEWKPSLLELGEFLALSDDQADRVERILDDAKHAVFLLASLKRDDGTPKIDDLVAALREEGDPEQAAKGFFASLLTERIPGRQEPYVVEVLRIRGVAERDLSEVLHPEQRRKLGRANLDYLGVRTSYDPFAEYLRDALR